MTVISVSSHVTGQATAVAAVSLARGLAAAGHRVTVCDGPNRRAVAQVLGIDEGTSATVAPRLTWSSVRVERASEVVVVDAGLFTDGPPPSGAHTWFIMPADEHALHTLADVARSHPQVVGTNPWLGVSVWDDGSSPQLASTLRAELANDVIGPNLVAAPGEVPSDDVCTALAHSVATKLSLAPPTPGSLSDLAGIRLADTQAPSAVSAPATSQYTYVMDGAAMREAGVSTVALSTPAAAARAPVTPVSPKVPELRRFSLVAVVVPWAIAALLALSHLVRG